MTSAHTAPKTLHCIHRNPPPGPSTSLQSGLLSIIPEDVAVRIALAEANQNPDSLDPLHRGECDTLSES